MAKPENTRTEIEKNYIENFNKCKEVNKTRQLFYNKHKNLIDKFSRDNFKNAIERVNAIEKLHPREQNIIDTYDSYFQNYFNDLMELDADIKGIKDATEYKQESGYTLSRPIKTERNSFGSNKKRNLGTNSWDSIEQGEYSAKPSEYRQVDAPKRQDELKIENATRDSLYKWYGEVGKARYDVDKDLNQFNKITKLTAKDFSNKTGLKVSDKMVREILPFLRERTAVPEALGRKDLSDFYNKLSQADITRLTKLADNVCEKFDNRL